MKRILGRSARVGRFSVPVWALAIGLLGILAAAGQAVGPVLAGTIGGSATLVVEQTVLLSAAPQIEGASDSVGVQNDEGSGFTLGMETKAGEKTITYFSLANDSGQDANARMVMDVPAGLDVDLTECASTEESTIVDRLWLMTIESDAGGTAFNTDSVDSSLSSTVPSVPRPGYVSVSAPNACVVFAAYVDRTTDEILVAKSTDGGASFGSSLILASTDVGARSSVAADAETAWVALCGGRH